MATETSLAIELTGLGDTGAREDVLGRDPARRRRVRRRGLVAENGLERLAGALLLRRNRSIVDEGDRGERARHEERREHRDSDDTRQHQFHGRGRPVGQIADLGEERFRPGRWSAHGPMMDRALL